MSTITTSFVDRGSENTILCLDGCYYRLQGYMLKSEVHDNGHVSLDSIPIVGEDAWIFEEHVAEEFGVEDIQSCIIGHSGETVHITSSAVSNAIFLTGIRTYDNVGKILWNALEHGIKFSAEGVDKVIPIHIDTVASKDYYYLHRPYENVPLPERHLHKSRYFPVPGFTLGIGSKDECNHCKLTLPELDRALQECIGAYTKYFNIYGISIKLILDKKMDKHHKELLRKFERFFNHRFADWKNLPYC